MKLLILSITNFLISMIGLAVGLNQATPEFTDVHWSVIILIHGFPMVLIWAMWQRKIKKHLLGVGIFEILTIIGLPVYLGLLLIELLPPVLF